MSSAIQYTVLSGAPGSEVADPTLEKIAEIYGEDVVKKHLKDERPSLADCLVFQGANEVTQKSYFELQSGRVVEVLTFKDGSKKCIGSFTYLAEDCSREGWAAYHSIADQQWCVLASNQMKEKVEIEDWSCTWNSLQNLLYIKTGMKMSVLEAMDCFVQCAQGRIETVANSMKAATDKSSMKEALRKGVLDVMMLVGFFSFDEAPIFCGGNLLEEILLGAKHTTTIEDEYENVTYSAPQEVITRIKAHSFREDGPLLVTIDGGSYVLYSDEAGKIILIDPHNLDRVSGFYAQQFVSEFAAISKTIFLMRTQNLSGKRDSYPVCGIGGLEKDINVEMLQKLLFSSRTSEPLTAEALSRKISVLATTIEGCETIFQASESGDP